MKIQQYATKNNGFVIASLTALAVMVTWEGHAAIPVGLANNPSFESVDPGVLADEVGLPSGPVTSADVLQSPIAPAPVQNIENAQKVFFELREVTFEGNHVFSAEELLEGFDPLMGTRVSLAQVMEKVEAITQKYRDQGYFLSSAILPTQNMQEGRLTIKVVEGYVSQVTIEGLPESEKEFVEEYAAAIKAQKPARYDALERVLLLLNDVKGFKVQAVVAADPAHPGGSIVTLVSKFKFIDASASFDNYGTRYIGPYKFTGSMSLNSLLLPGGSFGLRYMTPTHPKEMQYFEATHDQPLGTDGWNWGVGASQTSTRPQFLMSSFNLKGKSKTAFTNLSYAFIRSRQETLKGIMEFTYSNVDSVALGAPIYSDTIRNIRLGATYENVMGKGVNMVAADLYKGINVMGAPKNEDSSRAGAKTTASKMTLSASRNQFFGDIFSFFALGTSQWTNSPQYSAQQFSFGGSSIGRGYDPAQFLGDRGVAGKFELRMTTQPKLDYLKTLQYFVFYDVGTVWNIRSETTPHRASGASGGFGVRTVMTEHYNAEIYVAKPFTAPKLSEKQAGKNGNAPLVFFQVTTTW